ncbi:MAG: hypothetical protein QXH44_09240 [Pyrobaculum sp.]
MKGKKEKIVIELEEPLASWLEVISKQMAMRPADAAKFILWRWYEMWLHGYNAAKYPELYGIGEQ